MPVPLRTPRVLKGETQVERAEDGDRVNGPDPEKQYLRFQADMRNSETTKTFPLGPSHDDREPRAIGTPIVQTSHEMHNVEPGDHGTDVDPFADARAFEEWGIPAYVGTLIRLNDKVRRYRPTSGMT